MITLQEFLKSKNIKYLFYDPFVNIFLQDDWYYEDIIPDMKNVVDNIDKRFYVGPEIDGRCVIEGQIETDPVTNRHPNKNEHEWLAEKLYDIIS